MEDALGHYGWRLLLAIAGVGLALLGFVYAMRFLRQRGAASFLTGRRGPSRLEVLDTTAVDARRRLVLVRRDDVEHLIMIGGPTDVVIESRIVSEALPESEASSWQPAYEPAGWQTNYSDDTQSAYEAAEDEESDPAAPTAEETGLAERWRRQADAIWAETYREKTEGASPLSVFESARRKLFPSSRTAAPEQAAGNPAQTAPQAGAGRIPSKSEAVREQMNDFEMMLQAEMAARQRAAPAPQPTMRPATAPSATGRPAGQKPASSVSEQRAVQQQMARIFGDSH